MSDSCSNSSGSQLAQMALWRIGQAQQPALAICRSMRVMKHDLPLRLTSIKALRTFSATLVTMTHLDQRLTERALTARAPRYTSYPPATQFRPSIGPDMMLDWLSQIAPGSNISLYAHIPFCRRLCWFCACRTQGSQTEAPLGPYVDALEAEADIIAAALPQGVRT